MSATVETVRGPVDAGDLGVSLLHEHIFIASPEGVLNHNHTWGEPWWDEEERVAAAIRDGSLVRVVEDEVGALA